MEGTSVENLTSRTTTHQSRPQSPMDSPWDESSEGTTTVQDTEWARISSEFTNVGYREGITAGKEGALQEGFDAGFADVGAPLGREIGLLRGMSTAILAFLNGADSFDAKEQMVTQAQDISSQLSRIRFSDIMPRDLEAEEHARQHLEAEGIDLDVNEDIAAKRSVEGLEDMLERLSAGSGYATAGNGRPTMEDVRALNARLNAIGQHLDVKLDSS